MRPRMPCKCVLQGWAAARVGDRRAGHGRSAARCGRGDRDDRAARRVALGQGSSFAPVGLGCINEQCRSIAIS
eukprot:1979791-Pyramimonas_sp.AAC.1